MTKDTMRHGHEKADGVVTPMTVLQILGLDTTTRFDYRTTTIEDVLYKYGFLWTPEDI